MLLSGTLPGFRFVGVGHLGRPDEYQYTDVYDRINRQTPSSIRLGRRASTDTVLAAGEDYFATLRESGYTDADVGPSCLMFYERDAAYYVVSPPVGGGIDWGQVVRDADRVAWELGWRRSG